MPLVAMALTLLAAVAASADDTFTEVSGTPNPAPNGQNVTVLGRECDRSATVHPTGTITLTDLGSGRQLATGALGSVASPFSNCSDTSIVLSPLNAGQHTIQARYDPSGPVAVTASSASYTQTVSGSDDTFTEVSGTPNPASDGQNVTVLARECDRSANVHPTGTITLTDLGSGRQLGSGNLGSVASPFSNCSDTSILLSPLDAGQHTIQARYDPSGPVAVTASSASYTQTVTAGATPSVQPSVPGAQPPSQAPSQPSGLAPGSADQQQPGPGSQVLPSIGVTPSALPVQAPPRPATTPTPRRAAAGGRPPRGGPPNPVAVSSTVPTLDHLPISGAALAVSSGIALLILLIAFPAQLFDKTLEHNAHEIDRGLGRLPLRAPSPGVTGSFLIFATISLLLATPIALQEGARGDPPAATLGSFLALAIVFIAYEAPIEFHRRGVSGIKGMFRVMPAAMVVALVCGGLSWGLRLQPPYLYGLFAWFAANRQTRIGRKADGQAVLFGVCSLAAVMLISWMLWSVTYDPAHGSQRGWAAVAADATLFLTFIAAAQSLVFMLFPVQFLDGSRLRQWHLAAWLVPQAIAAVFYCYVLVLGGRLNQPAVTGPHVVRALVLFWVFGLVSIACWLYFRWDARPTRRWSPHAKEPGEPALGPSAEASGEAGGLG